MRRVTKFNKVLTSWETTDEDIHDVVHQHFDANSARFRKWWDVSTEGCRVWHTMFGEKFNQLSPAEAVFAGVAAAAYELALQRVANANGVTVASIKTAIGD